MIVNVVDIVNKKLIEHAVQEIESKDRDYTHFHPSEWDGCKRRIAYEYYEAKGYISIDRSALKIDPRIQRVFDNGHSVHFRWRKYLEWTGALMGRWMCQNWLAHPSPKIYGENEKLGVLKPVQCDCGSKRFEYVELGYLDQETWWGGHIDAVVDNRIIVEQSGYDKIDSQDEENFVLIDFKSINSKGYSNSYNKSGELPKPEHITQVQIYMYLSGLKYGKLIYENKDDQSVKEILLIRDDNLLAVKKAEAIDLKSQLNACNSQGIHTLPKRGYDSKTHAYCAKCKFRGDCWDKRHDQPKCEPAIIPPVDQTGIGELDV
jgi:hypothetical protein